MSDKFDSWKEAKDFQASKGDTPDSSKDFARAEHQARNDYQDSGSPWGKLSNRDRSSKSDSSSSGSGGGGCFVTTACVEQLGLADDCHELELLRHFRDSFLLSTKDGKEAVTQYYDIAPRIVDAIHRSKNSGEELEYVFNAWIKPSVILVENGHYSEALDHYKQGIAYLASKYLNESNG